MTRTIAPVTNRRRKAPSKNALIWGTGFLIVGGILLTLGAASAKLGYETTAWPQVPATVVDVTTSVSRQLTDQFHRNPRESLYLTVAYSYAFAGQDYEAGGLERGALGSGDEYSVRQRWGTLSVGQKVAVAVNPADPAEAYLVPGVSRLAYILGAPGLALVLFGAMFLSSYRAARRAFSLTVVANGRS